MGDHLRADLHHLLPQAGQRPPLDLARERQGAEEVGEVVGQRVELESDRVRAEGARGDPGQGTALPVGRIGRPEEVAAGVIFLMSNGFVTGTVLAIDGGGSLV